MMHVIDMFRQRKELEFLLKKNKNNQICKIKLNITDTSYKE